MKYASVRALIGAALFTLATLAAACGPSEASVRAAIADANHCEVDEDCVDAGGVCPFGCFIPVHKAEVAHIRELLADYESGSLSKCAYDCIAADGFACLNKQCTVKTETP